MHFLGQYLTGYGGKVAAPFNRFYMGGENDIRGFQIWGVSPIAWVPTSATVPLLNNDGSPRQQKVVDASTGATTLQQVTTTIPSYQMVFPGGDTKFVGNFEYRIPIFGPLTLALFFDAGLNKLANAGQLKLNDGRTNDLNNQFPEAALPGRAIIAKGTQLLRTSTGIEFQVLMPVVNAPFRLYWAYNPTRVEQYLQPPVVADRSYFPNQASFVNSIASYGQPVPFFEKKSQFRFSVGRTF
jgi:outer membrane protein insertion porin family